ncbi:CAP-associated domain-containing protein [Candidatus Enterococcus murrayae]|uniref:CAP-associated domain-containing protein n=1 Tax=Candidatus Enterococcus murrayae TaxID=2815321 RepID=A0ABS3HII9_9ENTE|nr:hypothetical protein [Enterococcus sp. MJM16]
MKRVIGFLSILFLVLIGYYLQPVLFPPTQGKAPVTSTNQVVRHKALKHQTIKSEGFADYVTQPIEVFEQKFGRPTKIEDSGFFFQTRDYALDQGILEVNVEAGKVSTIKVMAKKADIQPFKFSMTSKQLADQINLSADFALSYDEEPVQIELSENDMRFRPLIAFDNDTFAMLFFNGSNEKMIGAVYLDMENLLRLMPYQINSGNPLANRVQESNLDWNILNQQKQERAINVINFYRGLRKLEKIPTTDSSMNDSKRLLKSFLTAPKKVLDNERLEEWQTGQGAHLSNLSFELSSTEFKDLAKNSKIDYENGFFYSPMIDPLFNLFDWVSHEHLNEAIMATETELGVAIDQESVLVLLQEPEKTKDSE